MSKGEIEALKLTIAGAWGLLIATVVTAILAPAIAITSGVIDGTYLPALLVAMGVGSAMSIFMYVLIVNYRAALIKAIDRPSQWPK